MLDFLCTAICLSAYIFLFRDHSDGLHRADLFTDAATLAIFKVYGGWYRLGHDRLRTIKPAEEAGGLIQLRSRALFVIDDRQVGAPFAGAACFAYAGR
jgi:hypothetical protein